MVKCVFCGKEESYHKGIYLIKNDGSMNYYCSGKCKKNAIKLGRDKRKVGWTESYREELHKAQNKADIKLKSEKEKAENAAGSGQKTKVAAKKSIKK